MTLCTTRIACLAACLAAGVAFAATPAGIPSASPGVVGQTDETAVPGLRVLSDDLLTAGQPEARAPGRYWRSGA